MSKTWHNRKRRDAVGEGAKHHECKGSVCQHCGKVSKGGERKRRDLALRDAFACKQTHEYLELMTTDKE